MPCSAKALVPYRNALVSPLTPRASEYEPGPRGQLIVV